MDKMWPWLIDPYSIYVKPMDGKDPKNFSLMNTIHIDTRIHTPERERERAKNRFVTEFIVYSVVLWKFPILHVDLSLLQRTETARTNERTSERTSTRNIS